MAVTIAQLYKRNKRERTNAAKQLARAAFVERLAATPSETPLDEKVQRMLQVNRPNIQDPAQLQETEEPAPVQLHPVDAAAIELQAQHGDFGGRLARAAEMAKASADLSRYGTTYNPAGKTGFYQCGCEDARFRASKWAMGAGCKHALQLHLNRIITQEAETVAYRRMIDKAERRR
jgi:hypothetical protein